MQTNLDLLRRIAAHPAFRAGELDTGFLGRHAEMLAPEPGAVPVSVLAAAASELLARSAEAARRATPSGVDEHSPWGLATAWRLNGEGYQDFVLRHADTDHPVRAFPRPDGAFRLEAGGAPVEVARPQPDRLMLDGVRTRIAVAWSGDRLLVVTDGITSTIEPVDPLAPSRTDTLGGDRLTAPMPGRIVSVDATPGAQVRKGDVLVVLEAMKVQMRLSAPRDGTIATVRALAGELVDDGAELVSFEPLA